MRTTTLYQREVIDNSGGTIQIVLSKNMVDDEGTVMPVEAHRFAMVPGSDLGKIKEQVDAHLGEMKYPPISDADWAKITQMAAAEWTEAVVAAHREKVAAAIAEHNARQEAYAKANGQQQG